MGYKNVLKKKKNVDTRRSIEKKEKKERNIAMLSNKRWRKNHIMLRSNHDHHISTHMHILI